LIGYAHLVIVDDIVALIDVGSGVGGSNEQLDHGLETIKTNFSEKVSWSSISHVLISHGHIDHFGGLRFVQTKTDALIGVHKLDRRVLIGYEERLNIVAHRLSEYLIEAGIPSDEGKEIMDLYLLNKHLFQSVPVDFTYDDTAMQIGPISLIHVPGHCPGQVVFHLDNVLFSADHVLKDTSPHQAPEKLTLNTGLGHYLESLEKIRPLADSVEITLGGHEAPIGDLEARIDQIVALHRERLEKVLEILDEPKSIAEVSHELFPVVEGYHVILALEEAGAHVEYLEQRGYLSIENFEDLQPGRPSTILYRRREGIPDLRGI
jgi:glyoxylase-like metal-dependent hydrolase (beta-lactamase superfamily II)